MEKSRRIPLAFWDLWQNWIFPFGQRRRRGRWPMLSHIGGISSSFSFYAPPSDSDTSLKAQIPALRPKFKPWGFTPIMGLDSDRDENSKKVRRAKFHEKSFLSGGMPDLRIGNSIFNKEKICRLPYEFWRILLDKHVDLSSCISGGRHQ